MTCSHSTRYEVGHDVAGSKENACASRHARPTEGQTARDTSRRCGVEGGGERVRTPHAYSGAYSSSSTAVQFAGRAALVTMIIYILTVTTSIITLYTARRCATRTSGKSLCEGDLDVPLSLALSGVVSYSIRSETTPLA